MSARSFACVYSSSMDLSSRTLRFLTGQLAARRKEIGTRWRRLPAGRQALLALAHLRCGDTYSQLATGFGIGIATAFRYIREAIEVLSALAPTLTEAMEAVRAKAFVILDGTLLPIDRIAADTPYYSGKHKRPRMNVQVLADPFGRLLWASPALPGSTHDLTAARQHGIIAALTESHELRLPAVGPAEHHVRAAHQVRGVDVELARLPGSRGGSRVSGRSRRGDEEGGSQGQGAGSARCRASSSEDSHGITTSS